MQSPNKIKISGIFHINGNWEGYQIVNSSLFKYVIDEVKMLHCRAPAYGFLTCKCPECEAVKTILLVCKSCICPSCGKKYANKWVDKLASTLYTMSHRLMVFTIPEEFRKVLGVNHSLLKVD